MRASRVLQKCLPESLGKMHTLREAVLLRSVEALVVGRRLTLTDVARTWPGAERIKAPLKAFDRLLSNQHLYAEHERIYADMARWLLRAEQPVIVIDWSDLKQDRSWCLLRAAVPVGGRTLPVLDMVFPGKQHGAPAAEKHFLEHLAALMPEHARPILITDAGFRGPWFREVSAQGWNWLELVGAATWYDAGQACRRGGSEPSMGALSCPARAGLRTPQNASANVYQSQSSAGMRPRGLSQTCKRSQAHHATWNRRTQQDQSAMCRTGTRTVVDRGLARPGSHERTATDHAVWPQDADRSLVSGPEITSLRPWLRGQSDPQTASAEHSAAGQRHGQLRPVAGGIGV